MGWKRGAWMVVVTAACKAGGGGGGDGLVGSDSSSTTTPVGTEGVTATSSSSSSTGGATDIEGSNDVSPDDDDASGSSTGDDGGVVDLCRIPEDPAELVPCPPSELDTFEPVVEWDWHGDDRFHAAYPATLVGNLSDDNGDGSIDLCDTPDIVVMVRDWEATEPPYTNLFALDGASGTVLWQLPLGLEFNSTHALGDIDGDGTVEIVGLTESSGPTQELVAISHDGEVEWSRQFAPYVYNNTSTMLADFDANGDVEIFVGGGLFDHTGTLVNIYGDGYPQTEHPTLADVEGDEDLELIHGTTIYRLDGTTLFDPIPEITSNGPFLPTGYNHVADYDGDGEPEVLYAGVGVVAIFEIDGTLLMLEELTDYVTWNEPVSADFDGDGMPELAIGTAPGAVFFGGDGQPVYEVDLWGGVLPELPALRTVAFDLLGQGTPQLFWQSQDAGFGAIHLGQPRAELYMPTLRASSPVVADVDNDGAAEIVLTSRPDAASDGFTVRVIGDVDNRWVRARRIWNQLSYHVTNVNEDGSIPRVEPKSWELLDTYRTQARIAEDGRLCEPSPR